MSVNDDSLREKIAGKRQTGTVTLRDFDQGVVETLGAVVIPNENQIGYFIAYDKIGVEAPPGLPGIPIIFGSPEDSFERYKLPMILVRRDGIDPALNRWHPGALQYRAPAAGALLKTAVISAASGTTVSAFDRMEELQQAVPYDLTYTIKVVSKYRGGGTKKLVSGNTAHANALLAYVLRIYQPYTAVIVKDSLGDYRSYEGFVDSLSPSDDGFEVGDRVIGFDVTLRVEAELDLNDPKAFDTVLGGPKIAYTPT